MTVVKEFFAKGDIPFLAIFLQMPRGVRIKTAELGDILAALDVDEGIRIEKAGSKTFVNRKASGIFVVQFGDDFQYLNSPKEVTNLIKSRCGNKYTAWAY